MKSIKNWVSFVVTCLVLVYCFVHVSYMQRGYTRLMDFYECEENTIDVVFVGTSVTFSSFMPMEAWNNYGMAAFDYCTNVQFENALRYSIRDVLKTQNPRLIMIDVAPYLSQHYAGAWEDEKDQKLYISYNVDSKKYSMDRFRLLLEIISDIPSRNKLDSFLYYWFDICRYHTNKLSIQQFNNSCHSAVRGYGYLRRNEGSSIDVEKLVWDDGTEIALGEKHEEYLMLLIDEVQRCDCDVVFYCAPILFEDCQRFQRKNYIKRILEENGQIFWDFTTNIKDLDFDYEKDFWGRDHFDSLGAEKVTELLCQKILANYDIPDRRGDKRYEAWDRDYLEWIELKQEYNDIDNE